MASQNVGGILDSLATLRAILKYFDGTKLADLLSAFRAIAAKDLPAIEAATEALLTDFGLTVEANNLTLIAAAIQAEDWYTVTTIILAEITRLVAAFQSTKSENKFAAAAGDIPDPSDTATVGGVPMNVKTMTRAQSQTWLAENRGTVRKGAKSIFGKVLLRRAPEIQKILAGDATTSEVTAIDPARLAQIINALRFIAGLCAAAGAFYPPLLMVSTVLKLIIAFYDSNHPTTAFDAGDHGLSLDDLVD